MFTVSGHFTVKALHLCSLSILSGTYTKLAVLFIYFSQNAEFWNKWPFSPLGNFLRRLGGLGISGNLRQRAAPFKLPRVPADDTHTAATAEHCFLVSDWKRHSQLHYCSVSGFHLHLSLYCVCVRVRVRQRCEQKNNLFFVILSDFLLLTLGEVLTGREQQTAQ